MDQRLVHFKIRGCSNFHVINLPIKKCFPSTILKTSMFLSTSLELFQIKIGSLRDTSTLYVFQFVIKYSTSSKKLILATSCKSCIYEVKRLITFPVAWTAGFLHFTSMQFCSGSNCIPVDVKDVLTFDFHSAFQSGHEQPEHVCTE